MKKKIAVLICLVAAVGILGGAYTIGQRRNAETEDSAEQDEELLEELSLGESIATISEVSKISVNNGTDSYVCVKDKDAWSLEDSPSATLSQTTVDGMAKVLTQLTSEQTIEEHTTEAEKYGLDSGITALAEDGKGNSELVTIGSDTSDGKYTYITLNGGDTVYMVSSSLSARLKYVLNDIIDKTIDRVSSSSVSYLSISEEGKDDILIEYDPDNALVQSYYKENGLAALVMRKPVANMIVYPYNLETEVLNSLSSMALGSLVALESDNPADYGLDKPYLSVEVKDNDGKALSFKVGGEAPAKDDIRYKYIMVNDRPEIFTINYSLIDNFEDVNAVDFVQPFLALHPRSKVDSISMSYDGKSYEVELKSEGERTFVTDEDGTNRDKRNIYINGTLVPDESVATFYESIVGLQFEDMVESVAVSGEPVATIRYKLRDSDDDVVELYEYDSNFYRAKKGDDTSMLVSIQEVRKLFNDLASYQ